MAQHTGLAQDSQPFHFLPDAILQVIEFFYRKPSLVNQFPEKAGTKFIMLWNRESIFVPRLDHHHV